MPETVECARCGGVARRVAPDRIVEGEHFRCLECRGGGSRHPNGTRLGPVFTGRPPLARVIA